MQNYRALKVWQKAHVFTLDIYKITQTFPKTETYSLVNQMKRSASSIPTNIAEGCGRNSNSDLAYFLNIALGSSNEIDYQVLLVKDLGYISQESYETLESQIGEIKAMLINLISKVRNSQPKTYNS